MEKTFLQRQIKDNMNALATMGYSRDVRSGITKHGTMLMNIRSQPKKQRNELCSCGSGRKYKHCCMGQ